jgi:hypothetical protein
MKNIIIVAFLLNFISINAQQWVVKNVDNGVDAPYIIGFNSTNYTHALFLGVYNDKIFLYLQSPFFSNHESNELEILPITVSITFIKGDKITTFEKSCDLYSDCLFLYKFQENYIKGFQEAFVNSDKMTIYFKYGQRNYGLEWEMNNIDFVFNTLMQSR